jgi:hypothetical protein
LVVGDVTVMLAVPLFPSLVAVIVAAPAVTPCTTPLDDTVATAVFELAHVTVRPARMLFAASRRVACKATVCPVETLALLGLTTTDATGAGAGAATVTVLLPVLPSLVAVIVTVPAATPCTSPLEDTVAREAFDDDHVTVRPVSTLFDASRSVACS